MRNIRQNLVFAFAYNAIGIPDCRRRPLSDLSASFSVRSAAALTGDVQASLSSVSVIVNALRLRTLKL